MISDRSLKNGRAFSVVHTCAFNQNESFSEFSVADGGFTHFGIISFDLKINKKKQDVKYTVSCNKQN